MSGLPRFAEEKETLLESQSRFPRIMSKDFMFSRVETRQRSRWMTTHVFLIALYTSIFVYATFLRQGNDYFRGVPETFSPVAGQLEYYTRGPMMDHSAHTAYYGEPSLEMDLAWNEVFKGTIISVTPEELEKANLTSFKLAGTENSYGASLGVYHDLHCLKRIKQWMYPDYYYKNITTQEHDLLYDHLQHCFEVLRESLMCRPDISLIGYDSHQMSARGTPATLASSQRCVNWDALHAWSLDHAPSDPQQQFRDSPSRPENQVEYN